MDTVDTVDSNIRRGHFPVKSLRKNVDESKKYPHAVLPLRVPKNVDIVDNYMPSRFSPIFTTSPAPIVINKSPLIQFFNKKFSISSKDGK